MFRRESLSQLVALAVSCLSVFEGGELASGLPVLEALIHPCVANCAALAHS